MKLRIYGPARADLEDAFNYIAEDSPRAAQVVVDRILATIDALTDAPYIGRPGRVEGTRELVIRRTSYIAVYRVTENSIAVVRIIHGRRLWPPS